MRIPPPHFGEHGETSGHRSLTMMATMHAIENGGRVYSTFQDGPPKRRGIISELRTKIEALGLAVRHEYRSRSAIRLLLMSEDLGVVEIQESTSSDDLQIEVNVLRPEIFDQIVKLHEESLSPKVGTGTIHLITIDDHGSFDFEEFGTIGSPLEADNYHPDVVDSLRFVVGQMRTEEPVGRLTILQGLPGCGKTYLVRALLHEVHPSTNILVPSDMVEQLASPSFVTKFASFVKGNAKEGPVICLVEDGDRCLERRMADNMPAVSNLLNLSDGLLGALAEVHVVITTNAARVNVDEALYRKGRLCRDIHVEPLSANHAQRVYRRLGGKGAPSFDPCTPLSDVYYAARTGEFERRSPPERRAGFAL